MRVPLSELVSGLGQAVQQAQDQLERQSAQRFCACFSPAGSADGGAVLSPRSRRFLLPDGAGGVRELEAPEAALLSHTALSLDTVQICLNICPALDEEGGGLLVEVGPAGAAAEAGTGRLELTFRGAPPSEGIARVNQTAMRVL